MKIDLKTMYRLCADNGPLLVGVPAGVDAIKLLWGIAGKESSFGANCVPRHEAAYCFKGRYYDKKTDIEWGCASHSSYGPWQVMHANMPGADPVLLMTDAAYCAVRMVGAMNRMLKAQAPTGLAEIADMWNSGNWKDANVPIDYIAAVKGFYATPFPVGA